MMPPAFHIKPPGVGASVHERDRPGLLPAWFFAIRNWRAARASSIRIVLSVLELVIESGGGRPRATPRFNGGCLQWGNWEALPENECTPDPATVQRPVVSMPRVGPVGC